MPGTKHQTTIGFAHLLAPACRNPTAGSGLVRDANSVTFAESREIISRNGGAHDALGLQALHHLPHRRSPRELGMRLPYCCFAGTDLHMKEFEVRIQGLCDAKSCGEDGVVAAPATSQHEYVFHAGLLRQVVLNVLSEPVFPPRAESVR